MIVWFGIGVFVGMLPLLYYAALLDFGTLYQRLVRFHYLTLEARGVDPLKSASQMLTRPCGVRSPHGRAGGLPCATAGRSSF